MESTTRRRLRTRGSTRRRSIMLGGAVKLNVDAATAILTPIYNGLSATKAAGQHNLTYGEVEWPTLKHMVDQTEKYSSPAIKGRFYDLGCGRGRAVLYMALVGPFEQSVGIEVLPERVSLAQEALLKLKTSIPSAGLKVRLYEASFLNPAFKYKDARVVFLSNQAFDTVTQDAIFLKLNTEMPKGSLVFCSHVPSTNISAFEVIQIDHLTIGFHVLRHL